MGFNILRLGTGHLREYHGRAVVWQLSPALHVHGSETPAASGKRLQILFETHGKPTQPQDLLTAKFVSGIRQSPGYKSSLCDGTVSTPAAGQRSQEARG